MTDALTAVMQKIADRAALDAEDWQVLSGTRDLITLGTVADDARQRRHGDRATFVQVFDVRLADAEVDDPVPEQAGELRLVGRPVSVSEAVAAVRATVARAGSVPVTGFVLEELLTLSGQAAAGGHGQCLDMFLALRDAGLSLVSQAAADVLVDPAPVFEGLRESGLGVARLGVGEACGEAVLPLLRRVAGWEGVGPVCRAFAPLPRAEPSPPGTGYGDLRQVALARLLVDNIDSIQVDWSRYGPKLAQVALTFGADDVDAVLAVAPAEQGWRRAPREEIRRNIVSAGFVSVRRNACFEALEE